MPDRFDFTAHSSALGVDREVTTACQFCNSNCAVRVGMRAGRPIRVVGEEHDPVQNGGLCVKASTMLELVYNPDRLTTPLRRVAGAKGDPGSTFEAVTWDEALDLVAAEFIRLRDRGEAHAIASRTTGRMPRGTDALIARVFSMLGSPNNTDVGPTCNDAGGNALRATFGLDCFTNGYGPDPSTGNDDLGSAEFHLFFGTNQAETHPVTFDYLLRAREHTHARLVVVDPRRTPTAAHADEWVAPKPHTDLALVLAMLHVIVLGDLHDEDFVERWVLGFDELRSHLRDGGFSPRWAEEVTGVPAAAIERMATGYAGADRATIFCNAGISHQLNAFDTYRALTFLAAVTGNIGRPGSGCNFMHNTWPGDLHLGPLPVPAGEPAEPALPVGPDSFAESILAERPYRIRALITVGNPLVSSANTNRVREAFAELDFYVYTGLFPEEASLYADVILPACAGLEFEGVYMRRDDRGIRWQNRVLEPPGEARPDSRIWVDLAHALARQDTRRPASDWLTAFPAAWRDYSQLWEQFVHHTPGMGGMHEERLRSRTEPLRWPCPTDRHPGTSTLYADDPTWYEASASLDPEGRPRRFPTPSGRVEIFTPEWDRALRAVGHSALPRFYTHPEVPGDLPTVEYGTGFVRNPINPQALTVPVRVGQPSTDRPDLDGFPLMGMTGRPSVAHFATVTHWTTAGKMLNGVRLVQVHPTTAARLGIADHDPVIVESPRGSVSATAQLWPGIREDTVFVPNSFGPAQQVGDQFGAPRYEPVNTLVDDRLYDNLSGQQAYKCFACRLRRA